MTIAPLLVDLQMIKVLAPSLVEAAIGDFRFAMGQPVSKIGTMFAKQGGIHLGDINSRAIMEMIAQLHAIIGMNCNLHKCSARLQTAEGKFGLQWHQDYAPMNLVLEKPGTKGRVVWVVLTPIDGKRPTLEVAEPVPAADHVVDGREFLHAPSLADTVGTVIRDAPAGSCWSFSPYAPHRTHVESGMTENRLSLDIRFCEAW